MLFGKLGFGVHVEFTIPLPMALTLASLFIVKPPIFVNSPETYKSLPDSRIE